MQPMRHILEAVCEAFGFQARQIRGEQRDQGMCFARFAFVLLARREGYTYPRIGRFLHRDHSTAIHAARRAKELVAADDGYALCVHEVVDRLDAFRAKDREKLAEIRREFHAS